MGFAIRDLALAVSHLHDSIRFGPIWWSWEYWCYCCCDWVDSDGLSWESWSWARRCCSSSVSFVYEVCYIFLTTLTLVNVPRKDAGEGFHKFIQWSHTLLREGHDVFTVSIFINSVVSLCGVFITFMLDYWPSGRSLWSCKIGICRTSSGRTCWPSDCNSYRKANFNVHKQHCRSEIQYQAHFKDRTSFVACKSEDKE